MNLRRRLYWLITAIWVLAWADVLIRHYNTTPPSELVIKSYYIKPGACTTDTDCMNKFGGDGGPEPIREVRL